MIIKRKIKEDQVESPHSPVCELRKITAQALVFFLTEKRKHFSYSTCGNYFKPSILECDIYICKVTIITIKIKRKP